MDKLLSYSYPGNVRELENILERAVTLCSDDRIEPVDIQLKQGQLLADLPGLQGVHDDLGADGLEGQLESIQREAIVRALEQTRYNKTKAAELLGMSFRQLRYRVKKLGID
jgi:two-component system, NtrC family, response regulator PilR